MAPLFLSEKEYFQIIYLLVHPLSSLNLFWRDISSRSNPKMPGVGNLELYSDEREARRDEEILESSTRYRIVEAALALALRIHELPEGKAALVEIGKLIVSTLDRRQPKAGKKYYIYKGSLDDMLMWINRFL